MGLKIFKEEIKKELDKNPRYRELLFRRGYLFTNTSIQDLSEYPFYGLWREIKIGTYYLYVQEKQTAYAVSNESVTIAIIGHAYNPFDMNYNEEELCQDLICAFNKGKKEYFDKVSELTGLHVIIAIKGNKVIVCQDACSLTGCYFGVIQGAVYISEHPQLIADLFDLQMDPMVEKLVQSKCYNIGNRNLPGNTTPYREIKRLGANTYVKYNGKFTIERFYPNTAHPEYVTKEEKENAIKQIGQLIHNGIECCTKKWDRCAISLSGGTDSKTTLSCANGLYDKFQFFSFFSKPQELVDANGAKKICESIGVEHTLYKIPEKNDSFQDFDFIKKLLQHNTNYFVNLNDNEIRKYIYLHDLNAYDIELKSWASEVARVFFERKYDIKMPEVLNARQCSIFQTRFFGHPFLLHWTDKKNYEFLNETKLNKKWFNFEHADMIYWEVRMGCWGVSVISSQQLYHRVTMPMNNRKILEMFLSMPHDERKTDAVHREIMKYMNPNVVEANVEIANLYFHNYRIWMEKVYFIIRTMFYRSKK